MPYFDQELEPRIRQYLPPDEVALIEKAYLYAREAHSQQKRRSGEPYITHPVAVACILADMQMDAETLMAALMHDVIEDTPETFESMSIRFGEPVAHIVDGVSKLGNLETTDRHRAQAENMQKMVLAMAKDIRVILVKLADRTHNISTLGHLRRDKQRRIVSETLDIYAPIAHRLGMNQMKTGLEDQCFRVLYPMRARMIESAINRDAGHRKALTEDLLEAIVSRVREDGIEAEVAGRKKHLYGVYNKMKAQHKSFNDIMDIYGFRILVERPEDCYRALGSVHNLYKPLPMRFKDYIAIPKANGYQSLHTTLVGMHGVPIEVQIRTRDMERVASYGIAAHWAYKSNKDALIGGQQGASNWLSSLLEMQKQAGNPVEFLEHLKVDLFPGEIYVFSPKGHVFKLPRGATPVDFAYAVHSDVGNTCVACQINRKPAPLSRPLENGQTVRIITARNARPNPAWLDFVTTSRARTRIRHFLRQTDRDEAILMGKRLLDNALVSLGNRLENVPEAHMKALLLASRLTFEDELFIEIAMGNRLPWVTARALVPEARGARSGPGKLRSLAIHGTEGTVVNMAKCCHPIPGDPVMAHINAGRGLVIHRDNCPNLEELHHDQPDKLMPVTWAERPKGEFSAHLRIALENRRGLVANVANIITSAGGDLLRVTQEDRDAHSMALMIELGVHDRTHLASVVRKLKHIKGVHNIVRK